jgi:hypothetical protein
LAQFVLAQLGDQRLQCTEEQLVDALTGRAQPMHREMLVLQLERLELIDTQIAKLHDMIAQAMKPHQEASAIGLRAPPGEHRVSNQEQGQKCAYRDVDQFIPHLADA